MSEPAVQYFIGLDLGRVWEHTALAVIERNQPIAHDPKQRTFAVRHMERFAPGTPYAAIFARLAARCAEPPLSGVPVLADQTAVGGAVVESLVRSKPQASVWPVTVTAGLHSAPDGRGGWLVPRTELVGLMQVVLQSGRLKIAAALPEAETLLHELETFKAEVPAKVSDDVAAWRERPHDDLVLATALAIWEADRYCEAGFVWL